MNTPIAKLPTTEEERLQQIGELTREHGPNWQEDYKPGSVGCHELLDRTALAVDFVERFLVSHPACAQNREWYALASQAVAALTELYQRIGADHLDEEIPATPNP